MKRSQTWWVIATALWGCKADMGPEKPYDVRIPASTELRLIQFQLPVSDSFTVTGGASDAMSATVRTNVADLAPKVRETGTLTKVIQRLPSGRTLPDGSTNRWDVRLGAATPVLLDVTASDLKGDWSLGGLQLAGLNLGVGVSAPHIHFDTPNQTAMKDMIVQAGAGDCRIEGLSHTNTRHLKVDGAAGSLYLDFGGTLRRSASADIRGGVGAATLIIPPAVPVRIDVTSGVGTLTISGLKQEGQTYTSEGFDEREPHWSIDLAVSNGAIDVRPAP
ncbi:MAG: hypothetical protein H7338_00635 [Candidatus Sericytochromatia bacterium]|nr:hypothetical protein [Candidatus Sericytochromatia bacterium]